MRADRFRLVCKGIFILLFACNRLFAAEQTKEPTEDLCRTIMNHVGKSSAILSKKTNRYNAELYVKSFVEVNKRNFLMELAPPMFCFARQGESYVSESLNDVSFIAPDIYNQKIRATIGTVAYSRAFPGVLMPFFNVSIYSGTLLKNKFYSPLPHSSQIYYRYKLVDTIVTEGGKSYKIEFYPFNRNNQFVSGHFIVSDFDWIVRELEFKGQIEYLNFVMKVRMGATEQNYFLPDSFQLRINFNALGNKISYLYDANFDYKEIELSSKENVKKTKLSYNLTKSYSLSGNYSMSALEQHLLIDSLRRQTLLLKEKNLYKKHFAPRPADTIKIVNNKIDRKQQVENILSFFWNPNKINLSPQGNIVFSPIVNPLFFDYSSGNGLSYYQRTNYSHLFKRGGGINFSARLAYNFKQNELQAELTNNYAYWPERQSLLRFQIGNRNRVYNSKIADYLETVPKDVFDFDTHQLAFFNEFYWSAYNSIELFNGFRLNLGFNMNHYKPKKASRVVMKKYVSEEEIRKNYFKNIKSTYTTLSPRLQLVYTPGQYYYLNNRNKINLYSNYPTFLLEYERGFDGKWNTAGKYGLLEFDMRHQLHISPIKKMSYRLGTGFFINSDDIYFVNFSNFISSQISLPGWDSHSGGAFQLLRYRKYSTSKYYIQAHITYQAPLIASLHLGILNKMIIRENLYLGTVFADGLLPYNEVGYRVATGLIDLGVFAGFDRGRFTEISASVRVGIFEN